MFYYPYNAFQELPPNLNKLNGKVRAARVAQRLVIPNRLQNIFP